MTSALLNHSQYPGPGEIACLLEPRPAIRSESRNRKTNMKAAAKPAQIAPGRVRPRDAAIQLTSSSGFASHST